jgi:hypothetical protein
LFLWYAAAFHNSEMATSAALPLSSPPVAPDFRCSSAVDGLHPYDDSRDCTVVTVKFARTTFFKLPVTRRNDAISFTADSQSFSGFRTQHRAMDPSHRGSVTARKSFGSSASLAQALLGGALGSPGGVCSLGFRIPRTLQKAA